ncbi:M20 family metallo-hydrolase [Microvirga roseola]|uniref:M20 family metallo-hydrolase n=1 Tax=Microvirga roseola TaxID=2883126 RepID=UPI002AC34A14|nr:M20 family metallo-hydrolase [Microvirga roseola]
MNSMNNLVIDAQRLWNDLIETARIGGTQKGGIRRLTLTDEDRRVRAWFREQCQALGCDVRVDDVGNMFAIRQGRRSDLPPIAIGSHLDTQPTGGKFDGVLGVLAGLECLRSLADARYETNAPLMLVNWTNEEGSRFAPAMLGSGVYAGVFDRAYAESRADREGVSFGEALDQIGYRGPWLAGSIPIGAMFELHIEQGPILEAEGDTIGIVRGVQGMRWYDVEVRGREAHAGSTPMSMRRDALTASATLICDLDRIARAYADAVATVGTIAVEPSSRNVIPGSVLLSVDLRHPDAEVLNRLESELKEALDALGEDHGVETSLTRIWDSPPVHFHEDCVAAVRGAAEACGYRTREMVSGAGHDAAYVARVAPTAMIFVPCAGGLSHNEEEDASFDDCKAGAQVLLQAVLSYDRQFA